MSWPTGSRLRGARASCSAAGAHRQPQVAVAGPQHHRGAARPHALRRQRGARVARLGNRPLQAGQRHHLRRQSQALSVTAHILQQAFIRSASDHCSHSRSSWHQLVKQGHAPGRGSSRSTSRNGSFVPPRPMVRPPPPPAAANASTRVSGVSRNSWCRRQTPLVACCTGRLANARKSGRTAASTTASCIGWLVD